MKLFGIIVVVVLLYCASASSFLRFQRSVHDLSLSVKRAIPRGKRSIDNVHRLLCIQECLLEMSEGMEELGMGKERSGLVSQKLYTTATFNSYCSVGMGGKACVSKCLEGHDSELMRQVRENMNTAFYSISFICLEKANEFRAALPCYRRSDADVDAECVKECGNAEVLVEAAQMRIAKAAETGDVNRISKELHALCTLLRCSMKCESRVITKTCGTSEPAKLLVEFAQNSLGSVQKLLEQVPGASEFWPPACRAISVPPAEEEEDFEDYL